MMSNEYSEDLSKWLLNTKQGLNVGLSIAKWKSTLSNVFSRDGEGERSPQDAPPVPQPHLQELIRATHNQFASQIESQYEQLIVLEERLEDHVSSLRSRYNELDEQVTHAQATEQRFSSLSEEHTTLRDAYQGDDLPEAASVLFQSDSLTEDLSPIFQVDTNLPNPHPQCSLFTGSHSPLRVAALFRIARRSLLKSWLPAYRQFAVADLRLRILRYVLSHFESLGIAPLPLSQESAKEVAEQVPDQSNRQFDAAHAKERAIEMLKSKRNAWRTHNGEQRPNKSAIYEMLIQESTSTLLKSTGSEIARRHFSEVFEKIFSDEEISRYRKIYFGK